MGKTVVSPKINFSAKILTATHFLFAILDSTDNTSGAIESSSPGASPHNRDGSSLYTASAFFSLFK